MVDETISVVSNGADTTTVHQELSRHQTDASFTIPMEAFEKMYLSPQNRVKGDLRNTFANPTPLALMGFLLAATPFSCSLMGWRGAGGGGAAIVGPLYLFGGVLQIVGAVMEWVIGNTFSLVVFGAFGKCNPKCRLVGRKTCG